MGWGAVCLWSALAATPACATLIDFEGLPDSYTLTSDLPGASFTGATILTAGLGLNEVDFPPTSGDNVVAGLAGILSILFDTPASAVSGYFTYASTLHFIGKNGSGTVLFDAFSPTASNLGLAGFLSWTALDLLTLEITSGDTSAFTIDDLDVTSASGSVPEPASLLLAMLGLALAALAAGGARAVRAAR